MSILQATVSVIQSRLLYISITSNQVFSKSTNVSVSINLNVDRNADWKQISVTLTVELSDYLLNHKNVNVTMLMILCFVLVTVQLSREVIGLVI